MFILDERPDIALEAFLLPIRQYKVPYVDVHKVRTIARTTIRYLNATSEQRAKLQVNQELIRRWYDNLDKGMIDYDVYDTDEYLAELWACWIVYSKRYLRDIQNPKSLNGVSIADYIKMDLANERGKNFTGVRVADLGCGFGYTSMKLAEIFNTVTIGTNISGTVQYELAQHFSNRYNNFIMVDDVRKIGHADLVFASEYFEHIQDPIDHLHEVLKLEPRYLLIANAFNTISVGHFNTYFHEGRSIRSENISKLFNQELVKMGYRKVKTKLWNNRPAFWEKV